MYAAAGGASLASRQARQKQRQQKKTQQLQAKLHPPKAAGALGASGLVAGEHGASTPTRQSRQFHQLPTNYLRTPQAQGRKLSASYTGQSKLLLPIDEGDTQSVLQMRMHSHAHMHHTHGAQAQAHHHHQQHQHQLHPQHHTHAHGPHLAAMPVPTPYQQFAMGRASPKLVHRHSGSSSTTFQQAHLPKSATATLPLVSQMEATPPTTPLGAVGVRTTVAATPTAITTTMTTSAGMPEYMDAAAAAMMLPHHDAIIVTPATPMASPGHVAKLRPTEDLPEGAAEKQPLTADDGYDDDEPMQPPTGPLERKCSVYRMRRSDAFEHGEAGAGIKRQLRELQFNNQQPQYEPLLTEEPQLVFKGLPSGRKWQLCAYCEEGICVCEHIEQKPYVVLNTTVTPPTTTSTATCAQGRAAWLERGRRCSVQESQQQATCHRRWVKRNRIQDASLGGSSDDEDFLGVLRGPSTFANAFLYVGLGTVALGLVIAFVGTGEKGFKTVELRLIGPSLIGIGLVCCILRILFCICPSHCISSNKKTRKKNGNKIDADHTTSLLRGESKRVSIARGPVSQPKYPITHKRSQSKMLNEGMEALRQIATTSLFMQNEQKPPSMNRVVPIIKEPENANDAPLEMKKLDTVINVCELSDEEHEDDDDEQTTIISNKRQQLLKNAQSTATTTTAVTRTKTTTTTSSSTTNNSTKIMFEDELPGSTSTKLARQRYALHQQHQQQQHQKQQHKPMEQSQSLSSSSTVKDSLDGADGGLLMETSLMELKAPKPTQLPITKTATTTAAARKPTSSSRRASDGRAVHVPTSMSAGAIPRLKSAAFTTPTATAALGRATNATYAASGAVPKTATTTTTTTPPQMPHSTIGAHTGAIPRIPTSMSYPTSYASYDLPSSLPHHTYAGAATVRGPLGMPLSALTASCSTYTMPASQTGSAATTATVSASSTASILAPQVLQQQYQHQQQPQSATTTSGISLLPLPAPPPTYTATANAPSIPGQILDLAPAAAYTAHLQLQRHSTQPQIATTSLSLLLPMTPAPTLARPTSLPPTTNNATATAAAAAASSSMSRPPLALGASITSSSAYMFPTATQSRANAGLSLLAPPTTTPPASKFEPELVLSPAKLGQ